METASACALRINPCKSILRERKSRKWLSPAVVREYFQTGHFSLRTKRCASKWAFGVRLERSNNPAKAVFYPQRVNWLRNKPFSLESFQQKRYAKAHGCYWNFIIIFRRPLFVSFVEKGLERKKTKIHICTKWFYQFDYGDEI